MSNSITKGRGLFGSVNIANTGGFRIKDVAFTGTMGDLNAVAQSGLTLGAGTKITRLVWVSAAISPGTSNVAANATEERSYSTGLTSLSLTTDDLILGFQAKTALASNLAIGAFSVRTAGNLLVTWVNPSIIATSGFATNYVIIAGRAV